MRLLWFIRRVSEDILGSLALLLQMRQLRGRLLQVFLEVGDFPDEGRLVGGLGLEVLLQLGHAHLVKDGLLLGRELVPDDLSQLQRGQLLQLFVLLPEHGAAVDSVSHEIEVFDLLLALEHLLFKLSLVGHLLL